MLKLLVLLRLIYPSSSSTQNNPNVQLIEAQPNFPKVSSFICFWGFSRAYSLPSHISIRMAPAPVPMMPDAVTASGLDSEKLSLPSLQSKMKSDPEGYETELQLIYSQFKSSMELFEQQAAMSFTSVTGIAADPTVAKDLGDRVMFLAHVTPFYPNQLVQFPKELVNFLQRSARTLPSGLRVHVIQALILLMNRKVKF